MKCGKLKLKINDKNSNFIRLKKKLTISQQPTTNTTIKIINTIINYQRGI